MIGLPRAFALALGQLGDWRVLRVLAKSLLVTLGVFALLGAGAYVGFQQWQPRDGNAGFIAALAVGLAFIAALWLLFRLVALAVLQFFADEVVHAIEARHYPAEAASARKVPFAEEARHALGGLARAVAANAIALPFALVLLPTAIGAPLLFWAINAWLLGREFQDMVWLRHRPSRSSTGSEAAPPLSGLTRFALGGIVAGMLLIPFANLLAPVLGAAAATHLVHARKRLA